MTFQLYKKAIELKKNGKIKEYEKTLFESIKLNFLPSIILYFDDFGKVNIEKCREYLKKGAELGSSECYYRLAITYKDEKIDTKKIDESLLFKYLLKASRMKNIKAIKTVLTSYYNLKDIYEEIFLIYSNNFKKDKHYNDFLLFTKFLKNPNEFITVLHPLLIFRTNNKTDNLILFLITKVLEVLFMKMYMDKFYSLLGYLYRHKDFDRLFGDKKRFFNIVTSQGRCLTYFFTG